MKKIKFITTFSKNGYHVYGKSWIESFLEFTKDYDNIVAKVYINDMNISELDYDKKVEIVDFETAIPQYSDWLTIFQKNSNHDSWNKELAIKFSYKSFVMLNELKLNNNSYVIWLDADSIFKSYNFNGFAESALQGNFIACQKEAGSEHVESGIVIFDAEHFDKQKYIDRYEQFYTNPVEFNSFGQFFDGYAINRAIQNTRVSCVDLNQGFGLGGIQSDPTCTFMNPLIGDRFYHNIGITGKQNYQNWKHYVKIDKFFQLIHGSETRSMEEIRRENLATIKFQIQDITRPK